MVGLPRGLTMADRSCNLTFQKWQNRPQARECSTIHLQMVAKGRPQTMLPMVNVLAVIDLLFDAGKFNATS